MKTSIRLYHAGYEEIRHPDLSAGRKNADFGQGFYTTDSGEFAGKWVCERKGAVITINEYAFKSDGLQILRLDRDEKWYEYIFRNRTGGNDLYPEADLIIGPVANDTIYDTLGIFTSGFLSREESLRLLSAGLAYTQIVLKSEKALSSLTWLSCRHPDFAETKHFREQNTREEQEYQRLIAELLS